MGYEGEFTLWVLSHNEVMSFDYIERLASGIFWLIGLLLHKMCFQMFLLLWKQNRENTNAGVPRENNGTCVCLSFWHFVTIQKNQVLFFYADSILKWGFFFFFKNLPILNFKAGFISTVTMITYSLFVLALDFSVISN